MSASRTRVKNAIRAGRPDYLLLLTVVFLVGVGLQAVYSATFALGVAEYDDVNYFISKQAQWALLGGLGMLAAMRIRYTFWKRISPLLMLLALGILVLVLAPGFGITQYGAQRWLRLGPLPPIQPSEFVKLAVIIYVSAWLSSQGKKVGTFSSGLLPFTILAGMVCGLVMLEPDLGTTIIIGLTLMTLFYLGGASLRHMLIMVPLGLLSVSALILGAVYRSSRLESFFRPWDDPAGSGFHIIQLLIALGSGGIWGLGVGASRQKFFYVPGAHTDGIFAIIGEELGFIGAVAVVALFACFVYRGIRTIQGAPDKFGALLATGITCWIAYQALINLGGVTRSIPLTGIPLPFISYGGSSLAATMFAAGILLNISRYGEQNNVQAPSEPRVSPAAMSRPTFRRRVRTQGAN